MQARLGVNIRPAALNRRSQAALAGSGVFISTNSAFSCGQASSADRCLWGASLPADRYWSSCSVVVCVLRWWGAKNRSSSSSSLMERSLSGCTSSHNFCWMYCSPTTRIPEINGQTQIKPNYEKSVATILHSFSYKQVTMPYKWKHVILFAFTNHQHKYVRVYFLNHRPMFRMFTYLTLARLRPTSKSTQMWGAVWLQLWPVCLQMCCRISCECQPAGHQSEVCMPWPSPVSFAASPAVLTGLAGGSPGTPSSPTGGCSGPARHVSSLCSTLPRIQARLISTWKQHHDITHKVTNLQPGFYLSATHISRCSVNLEERLSINIWYNNKIYFYTGIQSIIVCTHYTVINKTI